MKDTVLRNLSQFLVMWLDLRYHKGEKMIEIEVVSYIFPFLIKTKMKQVGSKR